MTTTALDVHEIARRRKGSESMAAIAKDYGVSRERIRQVLMEKFGTTWSDELSSEAASTKAAAVAQWRESLLDRAEAGEALTREDVVDASPVPVETVEEVLGEYAWAVGFSQKGRDRYDERAIVKAMQRVWREHVKPEPLSRAAYDAHRRPDEVSGARIAQRMPWSEACTLAKVPYVPARRESYSRLSPEVATEWVSAFLADAVEHQARGSAAEYDAWAKRSGGPSLGSVRAVLGSWNDVRAAATPAVVTWQRRGKRKAFPIPAEPGTIQYPREDVESWRAMREDDPALTIRELSTRTGVAESTLRYHLEP